MRASCCPAFPSLGKIATVSGQMQAGEATERSRAQSDTASRTENQRNGNPGQTDAGDTGKTKSVCSVWENLRGVTSTVRRNPIIWIIKSSPLAGERPSLLLACIPRLLMLMQHELPMFSDIAWPYHKDYCPRHSDLNVRFEVTHKKSL